MNEMKNAALHRLAEAAGISVEWEDAASAPQRVGDESLRAVLAALGFPADSDEQIRASQATLQQEMADARLPLITAEAGQPVLLNGLAGRYVLTLESGAMVAGATALNGAGAELPPIDEPGYHVLQIGDARMTIAVAPPRAYTLEDAGGGKKLWGLALQLYSLRRDGDAGIGDLAALRAFVQQAARHGADAVAISPVHALFCADVTRYGPYAPSNRAALNVLHIAQGPEAAPTADGLIDWPNAAAAKLQALRTAFSDFQDHASLQEFRRESGQGLERHAIFEALCAALAERDPAMLEWRNWPEEYRNPEARAVARFAEENAEAVSFHAWLQYQAANGLAEAQQAARQAGMKIGLIADLAVGTHPAGSHSWSRQDEVLGGLVVGAPPDLYNREGQSWGITAFSPRGLRHSGFAAFIDMLRHALRSAGGVRIDHVMGLARLWVIPHGLGPADGAYLKMPAQDLMRLVALESQRHQAVIIGEDLGTVPPGFQELLDGAGIAGQRVMWFERDEKAFKPPALWTQTAVAMTTTHDLPTVAGWWRGNDIEWRERVGKAGEGHETRRQDRQALWAAFQASGATDAPQPADTDGAAVTAACAHLGRAACTLALLPVEDMVAAVEQPNLPGADAQHPNWRRRLSETAETLFARPDVTARLAALDAARKL
jgi:4-alpha-glucanotransferase